MFHEKGKTFSIFAFFTCLSPIRFFPFHGKKWKKEEAVKKKYVEKDRRKQEKTGGKENGEKRWNAEEVLLTFPRLFIFLFHSFFLHLSLFDSN